MDKDTIKETVKNAPKKVKNIFSKENMKNSWNKLYLENPIILKKKRNS